MSHACCGHGSLDAAYVVLGGVPDQDARTIPYSIQLHGADAGRFFDLVAGGWHWRRGEAGVMPPQYARLFQ